jgi:hypothetical protein
VVKSTILPPAIVALPDGKGHFGKPIYANPCQQTCQQNIDFFGPKW